MSWLSSAIGHRVNEAKKAANKYVSAHKAAINSDINFQKKTAKERAAAALIYAGGAALAGGAAAGGAAAGSAASTASTTSTIEQIGASIETFIKPITDTINSVAKVANDINDKIIKPISDDISATKRTLTTLTNEYNTDLKEGLKGIVKLPGQLANAMSSEAATLKQSQEEMSSNQTSIAQHIIGPALNDGIGGPLGDMRDSITAPPFTTEQGAAYSPSVSLDEKITTDEWLQYVKDFEKTLASPNGFLGWLYKYAWEMLKAGEFALGQITQQAEEVKQRAREDLPVTLLGVNEAIDAYMRNVISEDDLTTELRKHGIDATRQQVLVDIAQFLFSPTDAVHLLNRGIVTFDEFTTLMGQNNLDNGQAQALIQLLEHIIGPGDIVAAKARGIVSSDLAQKLQQANNVTPEMVDIITHLELDLISPRLMADLTGRAEAASEGLFKAELDQPAPEGIAAQFDRTQAEKGAADLEWIAHWHVPGPEWFVKAYFRGNITRDFMHLGFKANNVPQSAWDLVLSNEEELPPVWLIPDIIGSGVWGKDQAVPQFEKIGFSPENAEVLYNYGATKIKHPKQAITGPLHELSVGLATQMFEDGTITVDQYKEILTEHKYTDTEATLITKHISLKMLAETRKNDAQDVIDQVMLGTISATDAQSKLYNLGMETAEVDKWMLKLERAILHNNKIPSHADLDKFYTKKIITDQEYIQYMELNGYSQSWAENYLLLLQMGG